MAVLPPELWLHILHIAIKLCADEYRPFQPIPDQRLGAHVALVARLTLVCRLSHTWLLPTLYIDVKISQEPIPFPQHVRRAVLPYTPTSYDSNPDPLIVVDHLRQFAQLEILTRPPGRRVGKRFTGPPPVVLPSLQSLEWCLIEDTNDGGINSVINVVSERPNLRYLLLLVGGPVFARPTERRTKSLLKLETLRLATQATWIIAILSQSLVFPALKTLILDRATVYGLIAPFMRDIGRTVTRLELGDDVVFSTENWLQSVLQDFPTLQNLGYYLCAAVEA